MKFMRQGKAYQLLVSNGQGLADVLELDEALWVASSAPGSTFRLDPQFLRCLNADGNNYVNSGELKRAVRWLLQMLPDPKGITADFDGKLQLRAIEASSPAGLALLQSARYILSETGAADQEHITLAQIREFFEIVKNRPLNGDGIVSLRCAGIAAHPLFLEATRDAIAVTGGSPDVDGSAGISPAQFIEFFQGIPAYLEWQQAMAEAVSGEDRRLLPLGAETPARLLLLNQYRHEVSHFFRLSRALAFDHRLQNKAMGTETRLSALDPANAGEVDAYLKQLPLAAPTPQCVLPLNPAQLNPVRLSWMEQVRTLVLEPLLGPGMESISEAEWQQVEAAFVPYETYLQKKPPMPLETIPVDRLRRYTMEPALPEECRNLSAKDAVVTEILNVAREVERLLLFRTWMIRFVNNFVSFPELYDRRKTSLFECGTLLMDGRWFHVAFPVDNLAAHQAQAKNSNLFILYVEVEKGTTPNPLVAVPVTTGSKGNLAIGKRGVFTDLEKKQYGAKVVQIIENPVCLREALCAPFTRVGKLMESKIENWSGATEKAFHSGVDKAVVLPAPGTPVAAAPVAAKPGDKSGAFLGLTVGFAAIGSSLAFISKTMAGMSPKSITLTFLGAMLVLLFPITLLAVIKLRRQDLSTLLEGNGWAINARMRLTNTQRRNFSRFGIFPKDAEGTPTRYWLRFLLTLLLLVVLAASTYYLYRECTSCENPEAAAETSTVPVPPVPPAPP